MSIEFRHTLPGTTYSYERIVFSFVESSMFVSGSRNLDPSYVFMPVSVQYIYRADTRLAHNTKATS